MESIDTARIEAAYGLSVKACKAAPHGYWAQTCRLCTDGGEYFLKIHNNYPWKSEFIASLPIQAEIARRFDYVPKPIETRDGRFCCDLDENRVAALYTCIEGDKYETENPYEIFRLMSNIYSLDLKCENRFKYKLYAQNEVQKLESGDLKISSPPLEAFIDEYRESLLCFYPLYVELCEYMLNGGGRDYITHGDIAVNLMRDESGKVYIIDWDRIRMGRIEYDLREFADSRTDIDTLNAAAEDAKLEWRFDSRSHNYFVLNTLYYNIRNIIGMDAGGRLISEDDLTGQRKFCDSVELKLIL